MTVQFIESNGQKQFAVLPIAEYEQLLDIAEMASDISSYDAAKLSQEERIPGELVGRLINGENKLKVWREYRGYTQSELAAQASVSQPTIAQLETGSRHGSNTVLKKLAGALNLDLDDLLS